MTTEEIRTIKQPISGLEEKLNAFKESVDDFHEKANQKNLSDAIIHNEFKHCLEKLNESTKAILEQTTKTNGRVTRTEKVLLISGVVLVTLLVANGSKLLAIIGILI